MWETLAPEGAAWVRAEARAESRAAWGNQFLRVESGTRAERGEVLAEERGASPVSIGWTPLPELRGLVVMSHVADEALAAEIEQDVHLTLWFSRGTPPAHRR